MFARSDTRPFSMVTAIKGPTAEPIRRIALRNGRDGIRRGATKNKTFDLASATDGRIPKVTHELLFVRRRLLLRSGSV